MKRLLLSLGLAALTLPAIAARPWIVPSANFVEGKEPVVTIDAALSENLFEFDKLPLKLDGTQIVQPDGSTVALTGVILGRLRSTADIKLAQTGTYRIVLAGVTANAFYKIGGENKRWSGSEEALASAIPKEAEELRATIIHSRVETFVTANEANQGALKPAGVGLELQPISHPTEFRAGETARVRFLLDGKPMADFPFSLIPGGVRYRGVLNEKRYTTDSKGEASFVLPEPGMYWVNASWPLNMGLPPAAGSAPVHRYVYSGTVEILPQ